jgi:DNA-binding CsgD family transcriptional regulator
MKKEAKVTVVTKKDFKVSGWSLRYYNEKELENILSAVNFAGGSNFYISDYYRKKIIVDSSSSLILCGHSKAEADRLGFDFFHNILSDEEWNWLHQINKECYKFFFDYPKEKRQDLLLSYDLAVLTTKGKEFILHHHTVPYKLCQNGNMWLGFCHVWTSSEKKSGNPHIIDRKTGEQYDFIDNKFVKSNTHILTQEEVMILNWMVQELSDEKMSEQLGTSTVANFKRKKRELYNKLGVSAAAAAIHKAHLMGII